VSQELTRLRQLRLVRFLIISGRSADLDQLLDQQQLIQLRQLLQSQGLAGFDRLIAYQERRIQYIGSMQSVALGLADQSALIGVERRVGQGSVMLEYDRAKLPIDGLHADTLTFAARWPSSRDSEFTLRVGLSDAEGYERASFIGLALRLYFD
jgi:hypothetical protein